jgi:hypothetical protein
MKRFIVWLHNEEIRKHEGYHVRPTRTPHRRKNRQQRRFWQSYSRRLMEHLLDSYKATCDGSDRLNAILKQLAAKVGLEKYQVLTDHMRQETREAVIEALKRPISRKNLKLWRSVFNPTKNNRQTNQMIYSLLPQRR